MHQKQWSHLPNTILHPGIILRGGGGGGGRGGGGGEDENIHVMCMCGCVSLLTTAVVADNLRYLLPLISQPDQQQYSNSKRVRHLNQLAKVSDSAATTVCSAICTCTTMYMCTSSSAVCKMQYCEKYIW